MTLAEKLIEVGNNRPKLYNKGYLDASPQETVSGEAIGITDISPVEHNMGVKISGVDDTSTVKLYKQGKNLLDKNSIEIITAYIDSAGLWSISADSKSFRIPCKPNTTYTLMGENPSNTVFRVGYTTTDDLPHNKGANDIKKVQLYNFYRYTSFTPITITTGNNAKYLVIQLGGGEWDKNIAKLQIEIGNSATEYEPYIEPVIYDVQADGIVEGVKSLYPSTTLYTDTSGAVIDCTYYQDGKKVKENLTDIILSLGGVINE